MEHLVSYKELTYEEYRTRAPRPELGRAQFENHILPLMERIYHLECLNTAQTNLLSVFRNDLAVLADKVDALEKERHNLQSRYDRLSDADIRTLNYLVTVPSSEKLFEEREAHRKAMEAKDSYAKAQIGHLRARAEKVEKGYRSACTTLEAIKDYNGDGHTTPEFKAQAIQELVEEFFEDEMSEEEGDGE